ncbi:MULTISPECIES: glycosyltransferase family 4 protein [Rhizobium]|uniref:Glycosyltransferase n=1 Tax=Rhizobium tropici TaxID=398 RepID=A0A6P1C4J0_RHITR|nr:MULTISPECIES: glycosyltransferase [Rhizobium]AGB74786.1 bifunctional glycosyltransferase [Rhizobium tropici CIAT 899]MBB4242194.1 glycosyltransferase involved in cell wall biosynthesis [Rhizobium tropici]MBB5593781.1 glycosyltransferase involved in cell wall biosynthesis [Rhizobium tropici]MBB6492519.1 glycosyltransferase involved in cell wall biosynthesis [Rhizobium tropici]NEV12110.1 glycosyltransferase [Rhizobium tropici]
MRHDDAVSPYLLDADRIDERSLIGKFAGKTVFFDGVFKGDYSLAIVNRHLAQALIDLGVNLICHTAEDDWQSDVNLATAPDIIRRMRDDYPFKETFDIHLRNTWPPVTHNMVGRQNAYVAFAWEELEFPQYLVDRFNRDLDLVTVISNFVRDSFARSGVTIPVEVTGNGCDHLSALADDVPSPLPESRRRRILHVSSCFPRKGVDVLIDAFLDSFRADDPVELVIKTFPNPNNISASVLADRRDKLADAPPITIIDKHYNPSQLRALYRSAAMLVAPSRGEGFGLPLAEAMLLDVPVVTTNYSGQLDFCRPDTAWLVDCHMSASQAHVAGSHSLWAEPSVQHLGAQMRAVLDHPDEAQSRTQKAKSLLKAHFSWRSVAIRTLSALAKSARTAAQPRQDWTIDLISSWQQQCGIATYSQHLYSAPAFEGRIEHIFARRIMDDALPEAPVDMIEATPHSMSRLWGYDLASLKRLAGRLEQGRGDVLWMQHHPGHFSTPDMELLAQPIAATSHRLRVLTMHSVKEALRGGSLDWTRAFDIVFLHSAEDAAAVSAAGHPNPIVIPHGVLLAPEDAPAPHPSHFTIGSFGFLMPHKNIDRLVLAFAEALNYEPRLRLKLFNCMVPNDESRAVRAVIENLIAYLGLSDKITARFDFIPERELRLELMTCDLLSFLYGHSTETATGAARIAMSVGRPLLCSRSPVLRDLWPFSHVVRSTEIECIAEAFLSLAQNPSLLSMLDRDRSQAAHWYSYPRTAARHVTAIEKMLGEDIDHRRVA